jgi:hypothetical protein
MEPADSGGEHASRNASEPDSARNTKVASPPTRMKSEQTGDEATGTSNHRTFRGGWGQRAWKDQSRSLGGPARRGAQATHARREDITGAAAWSGVGEAHR